MSYDLSGNTTADTKRKYSNAIYRPSHMVWKHTINTTTPFELNYLYSVDDQRIYKERKEGTISKSKEFYLRTAFGQEIAVCDMTNANAHTWTWYLIGGQREAKVAHNIVQIVSAANKSAIKEPTLKERMTVKDVNSVTFPAHIYRIKEKSTQEETYLLQNEKDSLPLGYQILQEIVLYLPHQKVWVENNQLEIGWMSLQEVLSLRSVSNESLVLEHFDPTCENAREIALLPIMPPRPSFYIYDHLGNTRVVFKGNLTNCTTPTLVLEYLGDYYPYGKTLREFVPSGKTEKYLTTQHERDIETGLDYRGARYYDADLARFLTLDPLANKFMGYSPYNYVLGNPVMLIDPDGKQPTPNEAVAMAAHVYGGYANATLIGGWSVSDRDFGIEKDNLGTGFKSQVYQKTENGKTEYTYATAGTDGFIDPDAKADALQPFGLSVQYSQSANNARNLSGQVNRNGEELTFVGHSLGGGEAAMNAILTNKSALTFNAAGVSKLTLGKEGGFEAIFKSESRVNAYIMLTDPLNLLQKALPGIPEANGNVHSITPTSVSSTINGHSIDNMKIEMSKISKFNRSHKD